MESSDFNNQKTKFIERKKEVNSQKKYHILIILQMAIIVIIGTILIIQNHRISSMERENNQMMFYNSCNKDNNEGCNGEHKEGHCQGKKLCNIYTKNAPDAIGPYSQAVRHKGVLYTSGQIAINPATGQIEGNTIEEQTEQVMKNLNAILTEGGASFESAIKTVCFLDNMKDFAKFNEIYGKYFVNKPARSCVAVKTLPKNVLVEVEVIASAHRQH